MVVFALIFGLKLIPVNGTVTSPSSNRNAGKSVPDRRITKPTVLTMVLQLWLEERLQIMMQLEVEPVLKPE